jgi:hypothetical protein
VNKKIIPAKLLAIREGNYTMYVFKNTETGEYLMCTKLPNWQAPIINIGDEGFVQVEVVNAGEEYYDPLTDVYNKYKYSNIYFRNFLNKSEVSNTEIIL